MNKIEDCLVDARLPTKFGTFRLLAFPGDEEKKEDLALVMGKVEDRMLVRVHSECFTGDVLHSMRCDCGEQFKDLVREIIGIDLSPSMLLKASDKLIYSSLIEDDLINGLRSITTTQDLFISADVFIYIGDLDELFLEITKKCHQYSLFVFSIESLESSENFDFLLKDTGRYGHSNQYIDSLSSKYNFAIISKSSVGIRKHKSKWVPGYIYILRYKS